MKKWVSILVVLLIVSCTSKSEKIPISFYFWRTTFQLTNTEKDYLKALDVKKLYVRYFDVALKNDEAIPVAPVVFNETIADTEIVPVVYIKNEVFLKDTNTPDLAQKVYRYINQINEQNHIKISEVQFDCDWSLKSKKNYFQFIEDFKKLHQNISATIRLHQVKYPEKTGVPDVSNGVLMYYNMGVISASNENSIYEREVAHRYIKTLANYPKHLDIALPIFSWGVHIRNNEVLNLIGGLRLKDVQNNRFKKRSDNRYEVVEDFMYEGRYLAKADIIKLEEPSADQLKEMISDIKKNTKNKPKEIIFYDLNEKNLTAYEKEIFKTVCNW